MKKIMSAISVFLFGVISISFLWDEFEKFRLRYRRGLCWVPWAHQRNQCNQNHEWILCKVLRSLQCTNIDKKGLFFLPDKFFHFKIFWSILEANFWIIYPLKSFKIRKEFSEIFRISRMHKQWPFKRPFSSTPISKALALVANYFIIKNSWSKPEPKFRTNALLL